MKFALVVLLLCSAIASSQVAAQGTIITGGITRWLNQFRLDMQCGFPASNLPPLAPLRAARLPVNVDLNTFAFRGDLLNAFTPHLDTFQIRRVDFAIVLMRMDFEFFYPFITLTGQFTQGIGRSPGNCAISGSGSFSIRINNVVMRTNARIEVLGGGLRLGEMNNHVTITSAATNINFVGTAAQSAQCNRVLEQQLPAIFSANQAVINRYFDSRLRPLANNFIRNMSLQDLLNEISRPGNPVPCRRMAFEETMDISEVDVSSLKIEV